MGCKQMTVIQAVFRRRVNPSAGEVRLQVAVRCWADPYLFPCRRNDQQLATLYLILTEAISGLLRSPVVLALSGRTMELDGQGRCVAGCG